MKILSILKKNKLLLFVSLAYLVIVIFSPDKAVESIKNSMYYVIEMLQIMPVVFLLIVAIEVLVPKEVIMRSFGEQSGIKGNILALILGSISAGPIYAAFPISKTLLKKGAGISNIVIILSAWAVVKIPMLANEAKFLGVPFMTVRWVLTVIAIFLMAFITAKIVKKKDLPADLSRIGELQINDDYCIACGLCAKLLPEYYEMKGDKAIVRKAPEGEDDLPAIQNSVEKCPAKAIILTKEEDAS
jgi:uncharacterized membrane protein YraQ (UPF0718 family)